MPVIGKGSFDRGVNAVRRGFDRAGLAASLGEDPAYRRLMAPFSGGQWQGTGGREDFTRSASRGLYASPVTTSSGFSAQRGGIPQFEWGSYGIQYDQNGRRVSALGGTTGGSSWGGATGNALIDQIAGKNGLPPAVLAAMVNRESSGNWEDNNRIAYLRGERMLPYVGIFESTAKSWGLDFDAMIGNQQAQLDGMAHILNGIKQQNGFGDWGDVAAYYFAGPNWNNPGWGDELGMSVGQYRQSFLNDVANYGGSGGSSWSGGSGGNLSTIWGNANAPVSYEFGVESGLGFYGYGSLSGLSGTQHTGLDVGVPRGSPLYSPGSGTVSCVGAADAGIGGTGGGACGSFYDANGGIGNITIRLDNGAYVVLGHSQSANVQPGQRVTAGQLVGASGGYNGDHVHIETRVPDPSTQSGYRIVDPRTVLGGTWGTDTTPATNTGSTWQQPTYTPPPRLRR